MKDADIMEALTVSIEEKIFKEWKHEGFIGGFTSEYIYVEIDNREYVLALNEVKEGQHFSQYVKGQK